MAFRSFTLNLSIILCKYFLKACATMTLISQFKSKFKTDCKAVSSTLACGLPHFIFEHLTRRIKRLPPRALPAVCQIFKSPGKQKGLSDFPTPPVFPISCWLTYILSLSAGWLLTSPSLLQQLDPVCGSSSHTATGDGLHAWVSLKWI